MKMRAADIIMRKRGTAGDGVPTSLTKEEISFIVNGYVAGLIPDYQIAALLMAIYFSGMTFEETGWLTEAMLRSGDVIDLHGRAAEGLCPPFVDKHSTGGVGDKISLPLAPIVAACGIQVPMMSGRALGHTGGTLDKLESIAGYRTALSPEEFARLIARTGFAMTGQTERIVPADRLLYALRDVTGTVESVPLITASILSKKVAEGSDALVFDVKFGSGAFMKTPQAAEQLAQSLVRTAQAMGRSASAFLTDMSHPLGLKTGNFLEIEETLDCLEGHAPSDVQELTFTLGAEMLVLGKKAASLEDGIAQCRAAVSSGRAMELFLQNVADQGGNPDSLLKERNVRRSAFRRTVTARQDGIISIDAYQTGLAGVDLGVGRNRTEDAVCPDAGIIFAVRSGSAVRRGQPVLELFGKDEASLDSAERRIRGALSYSEEAAPASPLVLKAIR